MFVDGTTTGSGYYPGVACKRSHIFTLIEEIPLVAADDSRLIQVPEEMFPKGHQYTDFDESNVDQETYCIADEELATKNSIPTTTNINEVDTLTPDASCTHSHEDRCHHDRCQCQPIFDNR